MGSSWWPFRPFGRGASTSSPANFLHLSRTALERIRELLLREEPLNPHQCRRMSLMLERTVDSIERMIGGLDDITLVCGSEALENFYRVAEKGKQLVENCCSADWCQASAFQIQNDEAFRQISLDTSLCYNTIWKVVEDMRCEKEFFCEDLRDTSTFDPSSTDEVFKDRVTLQDRLKGLVNDANISSCRIRSQWLRKYLLGRVKWALRWSTDEGLWPDGNGPDGEWSDKSDFLGGNVCKSTWLDVPCAKKLFQDEMQEDEWLAEAKILASLNHPNIVKFLCCNKFETELTRGHFIAMEQMDTSLCSFMKTLRLKEEGAKLSLISALDVILQIAHGMCYLHGHGIAHRDLKTSNVVVRKISSPELQYNLQVKIVDFGISKVKLQDKSNTMTRPKIGTTLYMPPEAFSYGRANWFKVDVYSFSVMCSVILSGNEPFQNIKRRDLGDAIRGGRRPELPKGIPEELALVITEGWSMDRNLRPGFVEICTRLEKLRHWLLRNDGSSALVLEEERFDSSLYIERMLKRRSETRERDRYPFQLNEEEEWFDGDEVPPFNQVQSVQAEHLLQQQHGAQNATIAAGSFQAGPSLLQLFQQIPSHQQQNAYHQAIPASLEPNGTMYGLPSGGSCNGPSSSISRLRETLLNSPEYTHDVPPLLPQHLPLPQDIDVHNLPRKRHSAEWVVEIRLPKKRTRHLLGRFDTLEEAALAYERAACKPGGEYARLNFQGDQGALSGGALSAMGDAGVPRVLTFAQLQETAYLQSFPAQIAGGDLGVLTDGALVDDASSEAYQIDMTWDALQLGECHPGTNDVDSATSSTSVLQGRFRQQLQLEHESGGYGSPRSPGLCVTSSNTDTNIADGSV